MITINEIAQMVGYSPSTVSIVLRGMAKERHISPKAEQAILAYAKEAGYQPNISARRLRNDEEQPKAIAIFWANDFRASMVSSFLQGVQRYTEDSQIPYEILIRPYSPTKLHEVATPKNLNMYAGAIICNATAADLNYIETLDTLCPIVVYNRNSEKHSHVLVDNEAIGAFAANAMISDGCTSLIVVTDRTEFLHTRSRVNGFTTVCAQHGTSFQIIFSQDSSITKGAECIENISFENEKKGIFVCSSDHTAFGILKNLFSRKIDIPQNAEIISIGTDANDLYTCLTPSLSVILIPLEEMAYECTKVLAANIEQTNTQRQVVKVPFKIQFGESTMNT